MSALGISFSTTVLKGSHMSMATASTAFPTAQVKMSASPYLKWGEGTDRMRRKYHNRQEIIYRLSQPGSPSIAVISEETGVPKATLYAWLASERRLGRGDTFRKATLAMTKRSKPRSPSVKFALLGESHGLQGE